MPLFPPVGMFTLEDEGFQEQIQVSKLNKDTYTTRSSFETRPNSCLVALLSKKLNVKPPCHEIQLEDKLIEEQKKGVHKH